MLGNGRGSIQVMQVLGMGDSFFCQIRSLRKIAQRLDASRGAQVPRAIRNLPLGPYFLDPFQFVGVVNRTFHDANIIRPGFTAGSLR